MTYPERWPDGTIKSQNNAFTEHLRFTRSQFRGDPAFRSNAAPKPKNPLVDRWGSQFLKPGSST